MQKAVNFKMICFLKINFICFYILNSYDKFIFMQKSLFFFVFQSVIFHQTIHLSSPVDIRCRCKLSYLHIRRLSKVDYFVQSHVFIFEKQFCISKSWTRFHHLRSSLLQPIRRWMHSWSGFLCLFDWYATLFNPPGNLGRIVMPFKSSQGEPYIKVLHNWPTTKVTAKLQSQCLIRSCQSIY